MESRACSENPEAGAFPQFVMILVLIVGLPGNVVALWIFCRMRSWKAHVVFLFNLLLSDFLLIASVPFRIDAHTRRGGWVYGATWCHINLYMLAVNRSASIAFMTVVAVNRYFKVVHPHHQLSKLTSVCSKRIAGVIWVAVSIFSIPVLVTKVLHRNGSANVTVCRSFDSYDVVPAMLRAFYALYVLEIFLPWLVLLFCSVGIACHLRKRQVLRRDMVQVATRTVVVISAAFTVCFMPSLVTGLGTLYIKEVVHDKCAYEWWSQAFMIGICFTYLNSALDPVIYFFSSSTFTQTFKRSMTRTYASTQLSPPAVKAET